MHDYDRPTGSDSLPGTGSDSKLDLLEAVVSTGLTFPGLARLLVEWTLACLPGSTCILTLRDPNGPTSRFAGTAYEGNVTITEAEIGDEAEEPVAMLGLEDSLVAPIAHGRETLGEIRVLGGLVPFSDADGQTLTKLARHFGFLLHHRSVMERVQDLALRDELTGLHNRRYLWQALEQWIPKARRERLPISLFLIDVDHFKAFNDQWGHSVGDRVLVLLGDLMRTLFRMQDVVCRYGGEEFAVLLCDHRAEPGKDHPATAYRFAERLRLATEKLDLTAHDGQVLSRITISGGIASFPRDASSAEDLLERADEALYRAKRSGRNRIFLANQVDSSKIA